MSTEDFMTILCVIAFFTYLILQDGNNRKK